MLHLAAAQIDAIVPQLLAGGYRPETPCAVVAFASWPQEQVLRCTLADLAEQMHAAEITRTAVIFVGDVLAAEGFTDSYLYSAGPAAPGAALMRILLLGGTAEARALAAQLHPDVEVISSLAGRVPDPALPVGPGAHRRVRRRRRDCGDWLRRTGVDAVVDATHPFAATITAQRRSGVPRSSSCHIWCWPARLADPVTPSWWTPTPRRRSGCRQGYSRVFLTTGRSGVGAFADVDAWFLIRAVTAPEPHTLPRATRSLLSRGPYRYDDELALLREHRIDALVTKNSGGDMTRPKLDAAAALGVPVVMVDRPPLPDGVQTVTTVDDAAAWVRRRTGRSSAISSRLSSSRMAWQPRAEHDQHHLVAAFGRGGERAPQRDEQRRLQRAEAVVPPAGVSVVIRDAVTQQLARGTTRRARRSIAGPDLRQQAGAR